MKLVNQGMILGEDGQKMSKSRGNVINPDFIVQNYGADSMRLYEMFMGPLTQMKAWSMTGVEGVYRFLGRVWRLYTENPASIVREKPRPEIEKELHRTIKKVTGDIDALGFNTAIAQLMTFSNLLAKEPAKPREAMEKFLLLLAPFAPHLSEELWSLLGHRDSLAYEAWPGYDEKSLEEALIEIPVMVNGKVKSRIHVQPDWNEEQVESLALKDQKVAEALSGKKISQKKYVPKKIYTIAASE
jgi:leucyl-tRNA synthetase